MVDLEQGAWENLRRLSLSAGGGGLAIAFLALQVDEVQEPDVFPFAIFPWIWASLLGALMLGLSSYVWRVGNLRWAAVHVMKADPQEREHFAGRLPRLAVAERAFVILSVLSIAAAFTLLVIVGFSLSEAVIP